MTYTGWNEHVYFPRLSFFLLFFRHDPKPFVFWLLLFTWVFLSGLFLSSFHLEPETFLLQNFKLQQWFFLQFLLPCFAAFSLGKIFFRIKTKCNSQKYWFTLQNSQVFVYGDLNLNAWSPRSSSNLCCSLEFNHYLGLHIGVERENNKEQRKSVG